MNTFTIKHFDDYHEIDEWKRPGTVVCELGCFLPRRDYGYCRYYAVKWTRGNRPSRAEVLKRLESLLFLDEKHLADGLEITYKRSEVAFK